MTYNLSKVLIIDTETTGLSLSDEILQLSIIDGTGKVLLSNFYKPVSHSCWPFAYKVNLISPEMVQDCRPIAADAAAIGSLIRDAEVVVGFNIRFDIGMIERNIPGISFSEKQIIDVHNLYVNFEKQGRVEKLSRHRLADVSQAMGFSVSSGERLHDALTDVKATLHSFLQLNNVIINR
ncbi:MAG: 3'-5' exonuclease [Lachnospiraceae bacterium]|nr:3'-5' exonuclease [Lachnospiraceae bacterium]